MVIKPPLWLVAFASLLAALSTSVDASVVRAVEVPAKECRVDPATGKRQCCKVCRKGKACGDSCIAASRNCRRGAGCACDADGGGSAGARATGGSSARSHSASLPTEQLRDVQRMLKSLGYYNGAIDGLDGPATRGAVRSFQRDRGLNPIDGIPGPSTRAELRKAVAQ